MADKIENMITEAEKKSLADFIIWMSIIVGKGGIMTKGHHKIISKHIKAYLEDVTEYNP